MNPYQKDAEACGKFFVESWRRRGKTKHPMSDAFVKWIATWAGHWGRKAMQFAEGQL